jgi:hypothetical protein
MASALLVCCGGSARSPAVALGADAGGSYADGGGMRADASIVITSGNNGPWSDSSTATDGPVDAPAVPSPPVTACATSGPPCPPPPPACESPSVAVLYYDGQCTAGLCAWQTESVDCWVADASCVGPAGYEAGLDVLVSDGSASVNASGCLLQAPSAQEPPPSACDVDAGLDAGVCPPPASVCNDSSWMVYYDDGQCVAGQCSWEIREQYCPDGCRSGGCSAVGATAPPT